MSFSRPNRSRASPRVPASIPGEVPCDFIAGISAGRRVSLLLKSNRGQSTLPDDCGTPCGDSGACGDERFLRRGGIFIGGGATVAGAPACGTRQCPRANRAGTPRRPAARGFRRASGNDGVHAGPGRSRRNHLAHSFQQIWGGTAGARSAWIAHGAALALAFFLLTGMHVVLGELVPKSVSLGRAERVALLIARPFHWFLQTFRPVIDLLDGISRRIVRTMGVTSTHSHTVVHSAEELQVQIQQARERGLLTLGEERFILSAIELGQVQLREIMVPRPDMHSLPADATLDDVMRTFATTQRSRIPVFQGTDQVLGFVHVKDMLWVLLERERRIEEGLP